MVHEAAGLNEGETACAGRGDLAAIAIRLSALLALAAVYAVIAGRASAALDVSRTTIAVPGLPQGLEGLRIAQISDLHSSRYGDGQSELVRAVADFRPDLIAVTGDFIDGNRPDAGPCEELLRGLGGIAPVYWVRGNHEYYLDPASRAGFEADAAALGAVLLDNGVAVLQKNGVSFLLAGMDDVYARHGDPREKTVGRAQFAMETAEGFMRTLDSRMPQGDFPLRVMLCHQPHYWRLWREDGFDLALCGHLHGWMIRLPGIGGLLRNPSRYFPEEDAGLYEKDGMALYISRGLETGLSYRNLRMNNPPELALVEIKGK